MMWGYQFDTDKGTYYTPITADDIQHAVQKIMDGQKRVFNGMVWPVEKETMFSPPKSGMTCYQVKTLGSLEASSSDITETVYP